MKQRTFAELEYDTKKRKTRREKFLERMDALIPWQKLEAMLEKYYPRGESGRKPYAISVMLRIHFLQLFYNISDPAMEDALYEIESMRRFSGLSLFAGIPDETTILNFRHFLERHKPGERILQEVNMHLKQAGFYYKEGMIVDASIIAAPTSTKNESGKRDPEMHQTKKGNEWHFGMKMHIAVDECLGVIQKVISTPITVVRSGQTTCAIHRHQRFNWYRRSGRPTRP